jgi:hypothetical protein
LSVSIEEALAVLLSWSQAGEAVAIHVLTCAQCQQAHEQDVRHQPAQYCVTCDLLWDEVMRWEAKAIAILPDLPEEVRKEAKNFKFMTRHHA